MDYLNKTHPYLFKIQDHIPKKVLLTDSNLTAKNVQLFKENTFTIIYFWGTWCHACKEVSEKIIPQIRQLTQGSKKFKLITIASESKKRLPMWQEAIRSFQPNPENYVALSKNEGWSGMSMHDFLLNFQVMSFPNFMIVTSDGKIISHNDFDGQNTLQFIKNNL
jgi:thiol-disulfide isomerase/thioredoxin